MKCLGDEFDISNPKNKTRNYLNKCRLLNDSFYLTNDYVGMVPARFVAAKKDLVPKRSKNSGITFDKRRVICTTSAILSKQAISEVRIGDRFSLSAMKRFKFIGSKADKISAITSIFESIESRLCSDTSIDNKVTAKQIEER